jgi:hypothetical protein
MLLSANAPRKLFYSTSWMRSAQCDATTCPSRTSSDSKARTSAKVRNFVATSSPASHQKSASSAQKISSMANPHRAARTQMRTRLSRVVLAETPNGFKHEARVAVADLTIKTLETNNGEAIRCDPDLDLYQSPIRTTCLAISKQAELSL